MTIIPLHVLHVWRTDLKSNSIAPEITAAMDPRDCLQAPGGWDKWQNPIKAKKVDLQIRLHYLILDILEREREREGPMYVGNP